MPHHIRIRPGIRALVVAGVLLLLATAAGVLPSPGAASRPGRSRVTLYADGKPVGQWTAEGPGRMEGPSYVFSVRNGVVSMETRVAGTFSVEQIE